jgi:glycosyltransferase involved in cell wall biosynthesis
MPTISVIVPAYNAARTILETINSVLQQTFSDFELIVINDGSTDQTLERLSTVKDPRLKIFSYSNGGLSTARNRGITHAEGEFIAFLDADDLWTVDKLELQLAALQQHPEAGVAYSWNYSMDEKGESFSAKNPIFFEGNVYAQLLVDNFIVNGSNCMIRKQAVESVGEFDPAVAGAADWDYWLRLAAHWPFVVVRQYQVFYRASSGSMSANIEYMERCTLAVLEKAFQAAPLEMQSLKKQSLANAYTYLAYKYWTLVAGSDGAKKAAEKLWIAIRLYPPILRDKRPRNLLIKLLLMRLVPQKMSRRLIQFIANLRTVHHQRRQEITK